MDSRDDVIKSVKVAIPALKAVVEMLEEAVAEPKAAPYVDRVDEMPVNFQPDHPYIAKRGWTFWPQRVDPVTGITIHHTMSHSPLATARFCTNPYDGYKTGKGYPSVQYHFWVSQGDGCPVYRLAPVVWQLWHDCTGPFQTTISVGMAGSLNLKRPPDEQLQATAQIVAWLMQEYSVPVEEVKGHKDRYFGTVCPGWDKEKTARPSGLWRPAFYEALNDAVNG